METEGLLQSVKNVGVYLRKSRSHGDMEEDLVKHKSTIEDYCQQYNWKYVVYEEIGSGSDIENRPKMIELLKNIEEDTFDAVFVFDTDRLGRGGSGDQERIFNSLKHTETLLVTANPFKVYDMNDESDETLMDVHGFVAKMEYKQIKKRMQAGKKIGLKMGRWVFGNSPYGYRYDPQEKILEVEPQEKEIVKRIFDMFSNNYSTYEIADKLNREGVPSPKNKNWQATTISRMLKSQVYLGHIVSNKTQGNKTKSKSNTSKPFKYNPNTEWDVIEDCHEPIISEDLFKEVGKRFKNKSRKVYGNKIHALTGLIICGFCGNRMYVKGEYTSNCDCGNKSGKLEIVESAISETVIALKNQLESIPVDEYNKQKQDKLSEELDRLNNELSKQDEAISRIEDAFESGLYDVQKTKQKIEERNVRKEEIRKEISDKQKEIESTDDDQSENISKIEKFLNDINSVDNEENKNYVYKGFVKNIEWYKDNANKVRVKVNYNLN